MDVYDEIAARLPGSGYGRRRLAPFDLLSIRGPDAVDFLQRLSTQDVAALAVGAAAPAAFLTAKGRLSAIAVIGRSADDHVVVEVPSGKAAALSELLDRYHFSERLELVPPVAAGSDCVELLGVAAAGESTGESWTVRSTGDGAVIVTGQRRGLAFTRCHGPASAVASFGAGAEPLSDELADCLRIVTGHVLVGVDTDESTLALEPDLDDHVSTTKGCYTGQEIVARIHTYGHVNRRILPVEAVTAKPIDRGAMLVDEDGDAIGRAMSSRVIPGLERSIAFAVLPTAFLDEPGPMFVGEVGGPPVKAVALRGG